jgi:hypothetical protein
MVAVERWLEQAQVMERAGGGIGSDGEKLRRKSEMRFNTG